MAGPWDKYSTSAQAGGVYQLPPSPQQMRDNNRQDRNDAVSQANEARRLALAQAQFQLQQQQAAQERDKQGRERATQQQEQAAKLAPLNALNNQLRRVWDLYAQGPGKTKGPAGIADYWPSEQNAALDSAAAGLGEIGRNAFRTPGVGAQSDRELQAFIDANQPSHWNMDSGFEEKLSNLENRLAHQYKAYGVPYTPYRPKGYGPQPSGGNTVIRYDAKGNRIK